ncbi:MAG: DUF2232 domain-containing protein [Variibacter sp.]
MMQMGLIGIAAGAASALLFASIASGSLLAIPLFYLAPLPILIAAIGWSHIAGLIAAFVAAGSLSVGFGGLFFLTFLIGIGLPAWWLGYLALLARPIKDEDGTTTTLEWYPVGRIVLWAGSLGALVVALGLLNLSMHSDGIHAGLTKLFETLLRAQANKPEGTPLEIPGVKDPKAVVEFLVLVVPPAVAVFTTTTNVVSLWLAARVVNISGRLRRPWPDLAAITFPRLASAALAALVVISFLPGLFGLLGGIFASGLLMAYCLLGLAILHALTLGRPSRGLILGSTYAMIVIFGWPILVMAMIGVADTFFDLRSRAGPKSGPPRLQT